MPRKETMTVMIGGAPRSVTVEYKRIRNLYLRVNPDGSLRISCPYFSSPEDVRRFIYSRESWILSVTLQQKQSASVNQEGLNGPVIYWLGEKKYVRYEHSSRDWLFLDGDIMTFYLKDFEEERIRKCFRKAAAEKLQEMIAERRDAWDREICAAHGLPRPEITVRYMTSRWGVCYPSKSRITMSVRLMHYPSVCLDYVLLHEYAHFLVPNHSRRFYSIISRYMPEYQEYSRLLK